MSSEVIEGIIKASDQLHQPLMLICTQNQIDWNGGYVNNWKTSEYVEHIHNMLKKYPNSRVYLCRDHCGPGFKSNSLEDVYKTLYDDIDNKFDLIHIDFSKFDKDKNIVLEETKKIILQLREKSPHIKLEVGTEENVGMSMSDLSEIKREVEFIREFSELEFFVVQTGSLVMEINQVGSFHRDFVLKAHEFLSSKKIKLKEHNADYLDSTMIRSRTGIVDAMNIAPQLGVVQTMAVLDQALLYGVDINEFLNVSYESRRWQKWLSNNTPENKMLCSIIAGHYNFTSSTYTKLISNLEKHIDIKGLIVGKLWI